MAEKNRYHLNDSRFSVNAALDLFVLRQSYERGASSIPKSTETQQTF